MSIGASLGVVLVLTVLWYPMQYVQDKHSKEIKELQSKHGVQK
jgi:hypothetical protein